MGLAAYKRARDRYMRTGLPLDQLAMERALTPRVLSQLDQIDARIREERRAEAERQAAEAERLRLIEAQQHHDWWVNFWQTAGIIVAVSMAVTLIVTLAVMGAEHMTASSGLQEEEQHQLSEQTMLTQSLLSIEQISALQESEPGACFTPAFGGVMKVYYPGSAQLAATVTFKAGQLLCPPSSYESGYEILSDSGKK